MTFGDRYRHDPIDHSDEIDDDHNSNYESKGQHSSNELGYDMDDDDSRYNGDSVDSDSVNDDDNDNDKQHTLVDSIRWTTITNLIAHTVGRPKTCGKPFIYVVLKKGLCRTIQGTYLSRYYTEVSVESTRFPN